MFISNNRPSFHLWGKENLVKHQKVSKYYENDCRYTKQYRSNQVNLEDFFKKCWQQTLGKVRNFQIDVAFTSKAIAIKVQIGRSYCSLIRPI